MSFIVSDKTPGTYVCNFHHTQTDLTGFEIDLVEVARFMNGIHQWDE